MDGARFWELRSPVCIANRATRILHVVERRQRGDATISGVSLRSNHRPP